MDARAINALLRRGETPDEHALRWFAEGLASGAVSDAQAGAFAMAVCLQGLSTEGRRALTLAMRDTGDPRDPLHPNQRPPGGELRNRKIL